MVSETTTKDAQTAERETPCKLLIADDQPHILEALRLLLKPEGYELEMVRTPALALEAIGRESFDGVLVDLNYTRDTTSGQEGLDLVAQMKEIDVQLPIVVMTAWGNIDLAVEAMRRGAGDFIQKPWENARLLSVLRNQMELHRTQRRAQWLEAENRILRAPGAPDFIASAPVMRPVVETMARIGPSDPVWMSGDGEIMAHYLGWNRENGRGREASDECEAARQKRNVVRAKARTLVTLHPRSPDGAQRNPGVFHLPQQPRILLRSIRATGEATSPRRNTRPKCPFAHAGGFPLRRTRPIAGRRSRRR